MSDALPAKRTDIALTVIVGNADDKGELTLQWLQPEVGTPIAATLTDPDGDTTSLTWTWYTSKVADPDIGDDSHWNVVANQTASSYTPKRQMTASTCGSMLHTRIRKAPPRLRMRNRRIWCGPRCPLARTPPPTSRNPRTPGRCPRARPWTPTWAPRLRPPIRRRHTDLRVGRSRQPQRWR